MKHTIRKIIIAAAVLFMAGVASATPPIPNRCPISGEFDENVGLDPAACIAIVPPSGATNDGEDIPGVTVVLAGVFGNERFMAVVNNRTDGGGDIDYRNGFHANAILVPIDADLPNLPLSDILASATENPYPLDSRMILFGEMGQFRDLLLMIGSTCSIIPVRKRSASLFARADK